MNPLIFLIPIIIAVFIFMPSITSSLNNTTISTANATGSNPILISPDFLKGFNIVMAIAIGFLILVLIVSKINKYLSEKRTEINYQVSDEMIKKQNEMFSKIPEELDSYRKLINKAAEMKMSEEEKEKIDKQIEEQKEVTERSKPSYGRHQNIE